MTFTLIQQQELPNGTVLITLHEGGTIQVRPWIVIVTTDGLSDRVINPAGEILTPGPVDGKIPHELWGKCAEILI